MNKPILSAIALSTGLATSPVNSQEIDLFHFFAPSIQDAREQTLKECKDARELDPFTCQDNIDHVIEKGEKDPSISGALETNKDLIFYTISL